MCGFIGFGSRFNTFKILILVSYFHSTSLKKETTPSHSFILGLRTFLQGSIKCAREMLEYEEVRRAFRLQWKLTPRKNKGDGGDLGRRVYGCRTTARKICAGCWWDLEPSTPVGRRPLLAPLQCHVHECSGMSNSSCNPLTAARQTALSMEFSRQEYWNGLLFPPPEGSSWPRYQAHVSCDPCLVLYHDRNQALPRAVLEAWQWSECSS